MLLLTAGRGISQRLFLSCVRILVIPGAVLQDVRTLNSSLFGNTISPLISQIRGAFGSSLPPGMIVQ
jgi:hypothetical protein